MAQNGWRKVNSFHARRRKHQRTQIPEAFRRSNQWLEWFVKGIRKVFRTEGSTDLVHGRKQQVTMSDVSKMWEDPGIFFWILRVTWSIINSTTAMVIIPEHVTRHSGVIQDHSVPYRVTTWHFFPLSPEVLEGSSSSEAVGFPNWTHLWIIIRPIYSWYLTEQNYTVLWSF